MTIEECTPDVVGSEVEFYAEASDAHQADGGTSVGSHNVNFYC